MVGRSDSASKYHRAKITQKDFIKSKKKSHYLTFSKKQKCRLLIERTIDSSTSNAACLF